MGIKDFFSRDNGSKLEYLEEERVKIWAKIVEIDADLKKKTSDHEKDAKQSSKMASEYRNKSEKSQEAAYKYLEEIKLAKENIQLIVDSTEKSNNTILTIKDECDNNLENITSSYSEIKEIEDGIRKKITKLESIFVKHPDLDSEISELEKCFTDGSDLYTKINTLYKTALTRKNEIDQLYYDIEGYTEEDDNGEEVTVEGLKHDLEQSYKEIERNIKEFENELVDFKENKKEEIVDFIKNWAGKIENISDQITELLPNALTAGLSHAYSVKKGHEELEGKRHDKIFFISIIGLVTISLIPFIVNFILWQQGKGLEALILDMPRLVLAILPLYVPFFWMAYSANKKSNLSKRLVEEYTHKEVLSKTFEGLSRQISNIEDVEVSSELRVKLLYNILNVSSENPGKLITDYNKADHPLLDALDKSVQLATAVDKLSGIPGFSKITKILDKKSRLILEEESKKAEQGLSSLEEDPEPTEEQASQEQNTQ